MLADRIGVLFDGRLAQLASPAELFRRPVSLAVARFLAFPNEIPGTASGGVFECVLGRFPCDASLSGPAVAVAGTDAFALDAEVVSAGRSSRFITGRVGPWRRWMWRGFDCRSWCRRMRCRRWGAA